MSNLKLRHLYSEKNGGVYLLRLREACRRWTSIALGMVRGTEKPTKEPERKNSARHEALGGSASPQTHHTPSLPTALPH